MTTVTTISIILTAVLAFLLGRCMYISSRRATRISNQKENIKKLQHRLDEIADSPNSFRFYEIEEDELSNAYNVNLKIHIFYSNDFDTVCYCLIKSFPFADDKEFAHNEAEELLDKLNEK